MEKAEFRIYIDDHRFKVVRIMDHTEILVAESSSLLTFMDVMSQILKTGTGQEVVFTAS